MSLQDAVDPGPVRIPAFCALCRSRCGAQYLVQDERIVGVEPWPGHPTGGSLCAKGRAAQELVEHPRRLRRPLKRTRPRSDPEPGWVEVGWDEALDDIAARLAAIRRESGAEAVAFSCASPGATALSDSVDWIERLIFAFGSPNFLTGVEVCNWHRDYGHAFTFGQGIGMPDYARTDLVILWGFNPGNVWLAQAQALGAARARGAKLLVVDPARNRHAADADLWLRVDPGTDAALALGLARVLIDEGRYDEDFVRRWSDAPFLVRDDTGRLLSERDLDPAAAGTRVIAWDLHAGCAVPVDTRFELPAAEAARLALRGTFVVPTAAGIAVACRPAFDHYAQACEPYTPAHTSALTGVPEADVVSAARMIGGARGVSYFSWTGISQHVNATQADRGIALLYALTGCVDAPGGNRQLAGQPVNAVNDRSLLAPGQAARALGLAQRPLGPPSFGWTLGADFAAAVLEGEPYRVRALVGFGANLLMSQADTLRLGDALRGLDFQVHCDMFESPTGRCADYLLPVNAPWEREGLRVGFEIDAAAQEQVQLRPRIVAQAAGDASRSDLDIVFALATRLGHGDLFFGGDVEAGWNHVLAPLGLDVAQLRAQPAGVRVPLMQTERGHAATAPDGTVRGFATPTRRVTFHSQALHGQGQPAVPRMLDGLAAVARGGDELARFPLVLCCAKSGYFCQSQHRGLASLRRREPEPVAVLHPATAAARGIAEGEWFAVRTRRGEARFRARFDTALAPRVVMASFGWWQACDSLGLEGGDPFGADALPYNGLVDDLRSDAVSGSPALRAFPCEAAPLHGLAGVGWAGWKAFEARVCARTGVDVVELDLRPEDGALLPGFRAGQYVQLALAPDDAASTRSYSLTGPASQRGQRRYRVAVRRAPLEASGEGVDSGIGGGTDSGNGTDDRIGISDVDDSAVSADRDSVSVRLHDALAAEPNLRVWLRMPAGRFLLPSGRRDAPVVLMAAGIGITPFLSLLETVAAASAAGAAAPPDAAMLLIHGSRDGAHHAFGDRIAALASRIPGLTVIDSYSRPRAADEGAAGDRRSGRVSAALVPRTFIDARARFYLCGPDAMLRSVGADLRAAGVSKSAIFSESFGLRAADGAAMASGPFDITFARSARTLTWRAGDGALLGFAERHGLALPSGCRVGQCESCLLRVRRGRVVHAADVELADDDACLSCVALPQSDLVIDA